jgi:3-oxoacyl-[acyl-carrier-protein] synthase III
MTTTATASAAAVVEAIRSRHTTADEVERLLTGGFRPYQYFPFVAVR